MTFYFWFGPGNLSVEAEVDLLGYCAREWKGETARAKLMRKVGLSAKVMEDGESGCEIPETNIPFCFMDPEIN